MASMHVFTVNATCGFAEKPSPTSHASSCPLPPPTGAQSVGSPLIATLRTAKSLLPVCALLAREEMVRRIVDRLTFTNNQPQQYWPAERSNHGISLAVCPRKHRNHAAENRIP